jgi:hypothetical protein
MGRYADNVSQILMEQGRARAQAELARGQVWGQAVQQLGQVPGQVMALRQQQAALDQERQLREQQIRSNQALEEERRQQTAAGQQLTRQDAALRQYFADLGDRDPDPRDIIRIAGPDKGIKIAEMSIAFRKLQRDDYHAGQKEVRSVMLGMDALSDQQRADAWPGVRATLITKGFLHPEDAPDTYDPVWWKRTVGYGVERAKAPEAFSLSPGEKRFDPNGQMIAEVPDKAPAGHMVTVPGPNGQPIQRLATADELKAGVPAYRAPVQGPDRAPFWVNRGGKMIRITEAQYQPGDLPASTREQGRSVTAGDASDLADFDTSLDELAAVRAAITPEDSTGIVARIGARVPYVTQITGWGSDAKKRQAVIDRVKQVIGKTLEGGVLRKEDEIKYEKILPNIGDPPDVAMAKLDGLDAAVTKRKARRLDSLADANYDVTKYRARPAVAPAPVAAPVTTPAAGQSVTVTTPDGQVFTFPNQVAADGFKKRAGIR